MSLLLFFFKFGLKPCAALCVLERQVVNRISLWSRSCRLRSCCGLRSRSCAEHCTRNDASLSRTNCCRVYLANVESTDAVEPTALILVSVYVERNGHFLA